MTKFFKALLSGLLLVLWLASGCSDSEPPIDGLAGRQIWDRAMKRIKSLAVVCQRKINKVFFYPVL